MIIFGAACCCNGRQSRLEEVSHCIDLTEASPVLNTDEWDTVVPGEGPFVTQSAKRILGPARDHSYIPLTPRKEDPDRDFSAEDQEMSPLQISTPQPITSPRPFLSPRQNSIASASGEQDPLISPCDQYVAQRSRMGHHAAATKTFASMEAAKHRSSDGNLSGFMVEHARVAAQKQNRAARIQQSREYLETLQSMKDGLLRWYTGPDTGRAYANLQHNHPRHEAVLSSTISI